MRLGIAGMIAAIGVFISTLYVFIAVYEGWDGMAFYVMANRFFMPSFAVFVLLGYLNRKNGVQHKRFIYVGTLYLLGPILDRAAAHLYLNVYIFNTVVWNVLFISLFIYDWITLKKIHRLTFRLAFFILIYLVQVDFVSDELSR
jgi:hypothetical protein